MSETLLVLPPWLSLSLDDGAHLSWLIVGVWAIAWGIRQVARALSVGDEPEKD